MNYKVIILSILFCGLYGCKNSDTVEVVKEKESINQAAILELDEKLDSIHKKGFFQGSGVAIVNEEGPVFQKGYGFSNFKDQTAYTPHTFQNIASISKVVLGLTLAKAIEDGHIALEDDINTYLDFNVRNPQFPDVPILVKHLTAHTSSIIDGDYYDTSYINLEPDATTNPEIDQSELEYFNPAIDKVSLELFLKKGLSIKEPTDINYIFDAHAPGTSYEYSNIGAGLTAYIIEKAVGEPFKTYSKKHIIERLGLQNTSWDINDLDVKKRSTLYSNMDLRYPEYELITFADGGLYTSVHDLGILLSELIKAYKGQGTLLKSETYQLFFKKQLDKSQFKTEDAIEEYNQGYNQGIFIAYERGSVGHSGGDPGVSTLMYFDPDTHIGKITFKNTDFTSQEAFDSFITTDSLLKEYGTKILNK